uniref:Uncharacterized protein n=1 Tax=Tanacetum cinerariifolium TaxID=118510 RepID=A0A6L2K890_TANCI|nr:hypothetical protein [Tanacetum cinerariifolium]
MLWEPLSKDVVGASTQRCYGCLMANEDGASWSAVVEEGEPVDSTSFGAITSTIGAMTSGTGSSTLGGGLSNSSNNG